jgi:hypothetical protein
MGKFIGIIAAALDERDGHFVQTTELLDFPDDIWVYYCRPHLGRPPEGWRDLAAGTLRLSFSPPPSRHDQVQWPPRVTPHAGGGWQYVAEVMGVEWGNNLFHLALPPGALPEPGSWDVPPLYGHADDGRFVLGWQVLDDQWPTFRFAPVAPEAFDERAAAIDGQIAGEARARRRQALNPHQPTADVDEVALLGRLQRLSLDDVRTLVFELGIDYDELAGETKTGKLRELLLYLRRQEQLPRLMEHLSRQYAYLPRD